MSSKEPVVEKETTVSDSDSQKTEKLSPKTEVEQDEVVSEQQKGVDNSAEKLEEQVKQVYATTSSWMGGLWNTLAKQGTTILEEVGKDFEAVKYEVGELKKGLVEKKENAERCVETRDPVTSKSEDKDVVSDTVAGTKSLLSMLSKKALVYIDNLDRDLEKVENAGAEYFTKIGSDFQSLMRETVSVEVGDESSGDGSEQMDTLLFNAPEEVRQQVFSTRFDAQLHSLHCSEEVFQGSVDEVGYDDYKKSFDIEQQTETIASDLENYPALRSLMEKLVPESIDYNEFWTRYYYLYQQIAAGEENRRKLLSQAGGQDAAGEKEFDWDESDDEGNEGDDKKIESKASTEASYDVVSRVASTDGEAKPNDDDSDDDWE